jgi:hypothetical protein
MNGKHPHRSFLFEYAEGLIDSSGRLSLDVASHVSGCAACRAIVAEMRGSLEVIDGVETIGACGDLTASILLAARNTPVMAPERRGMRVLGRLSLVAGLVLVAAISWDGTWEDPAGLVETSFVEEAVVVRADVLSVLDVLPSEVESLLMDAVMVSLREPVNEWERAQYRALDAFDDDIAEARLALASNPALTRASNVVALNRERKDRVLRDVYIESR